MTEPSSLVGPPAARSAILSKVGSSGVKDPVVDETLRMNENWGIQEKSICSLGAFDARPVAAQGKVVRIARYAQWVRQSLDQMKQDTLTYDKTET